MHPLSTCFTPRHPYPTLLLPPSPTPMQVTELFSGYVGAMLQEYARSPAGAWKAKDCAVYLVTALAVRAVRCNTCLGRGSTASAGFRPTPLYCLCF